MPFPDELKRLNGQVVPLEGFRVRITAFCESDALRRLSYCRGVLRAVFEALNAASNQFPSIDAWRSVLPELFLRSFSALVIEGDSWDLEGWIYWFRLDNRTWHWIDGSRPELRPCG